MSGTSFFGNKNIVAQNLRRAREEMNMSQRDLAIKMQMMGVEIDQQGISKIEKNNRGVMDYELVCFCVVLKTDVGCMLKGCEEMTSSVF